MKVFVVEDSAPVCERLVELIEANGMHQVVGQAATYREAVSGIAATQPDVGIFDIKLKCGSGIDALAEAKRHLPGLVGIVLSNYVTEQHRGESADAGASFFLDKSVEFERIVDILQKLSSDRAEGGVSPASICQSAMRRFARARLALSRQKATHASELQRLGQALPLRSPRSLESGCGPHLLQPPANRPGLAVGVAAAAIASICALADQAMA